MAEEEKGLDEMNDLDVGAVDRECPEPSSPPSTAKTKDKKKQDRNPKSSAKGTPAPATDADDSELLDVVEGGGDQSPGA